MSHAPHAPNWPARIAIAFAALLAAELWGLFDNPYAGLVVFVVVPAIFVLGLLLIPIGMWLEHRRRRDGTAAAREWFVVDFRSATTRRWAIAVLALTAVNVAVVLLAGAGSRRGGAVSGVAGHNAAQAVLAAR